MADNLNDILNDQDKTFGQKAADFIASQIGSWRFLIIQTFFIIAWIILNVLMLIYQFDPYPFILLNLFLSLQAAFTGPVLMLSQNRQEQKDRIKADLNYQVNQKTEQNAELLISQLTKQNDRLELIIKKLN